MRDRLIARWLFVCAGSVFLMAVIGAVTRLTESGLSIVQWNPVMGAIPPLNAHDWAREFALYQATPQYQKINAGMTLAEFKFIYFWEWLHRLWGRLIGVIFAVPLFLFWLRERLPRQALPGLLLILALGAAQGGMGWYMVKSGLVDQPAVSHYRLAAHLLLAFLIYALLLRMGLVFGVVPDKDAGKLAPLRRGAVAALVLAVLTMLWGAFVAGLHAGLLYNTFPLMGGHVVPPEMFAHPSLLAALVGEPATVQFIHRVLALLTVGAVFVLGRRADGLHPSPRMAGLFFWLRVFVLVQAGLGVATLLAHVPLVLATLHQAGAMVVLSLLLWILREIPVYKRP